jgi:hypothetical protein
MCRSLFIKAGYIKTRFRELSPRAYAAVLEHKWQKKVFADAKRPKPTNSIAIIVSGNGLEGRRSTSLSDAARELNLSLAELSNYLAGKSMRAPGGYEIVSE